MSYLARLYERTMREAYAAARQEVSEALSSGGNVLDCGAGRGQNLAGLGISPDRYSGIEWHRPLVEEAQARGLDMHEGDLNQRLRFDDESFSCVSALSVLEHLLNPCRFMTETARVLRPGGRLVLLTPNIATYFTIGLLLLGRMPSTGPHPDSDALIRSVIGMNIKSGEHVAEGDTPEHRHLVVWSFSALRRFLQIAGFERIEGRGFGLYPFPNFMQPALERLDPWHCHQIVMTARKPN